MKTTIYYLAIGMLVLFVGAVVFRLIFGTPCTVIGNYCVGDGWTIAGLAATILGVAATLLGLLGAFAVAAWWTGLDERVSRQVNSSLKQQEDKASKQINAIIAEQETKVNKQIDAVRTRVDKSIQEDLTRVADKIVHDFSEVDQQVKALYLNIQMLRKEYEDVRKISIDSAMIGRPWNIEHWAQNMMYEFKMVEVAERMVNKYLEYVDGFLSQDASERARHIRQLIDSGAPSSNLPYYWEAALRWQKEVNNFSIKYPDVVQQINILIEGYKKRIEN